MLGFPEAIRRSELELHDALRVAAARIFATIQEVSTLRDIEEMIAALWDIRDFVRLVAQHGDCVDPITFEPILAPTALLQELYQSCLAEIIKERKAEADAIAEEERRREWEASLPSGEELRNLVKTSGSRYEWQGLTFWREDDGWSVTNAYGVDWAAHVSSPRDFQNLIDHGRKTDFDIGAILHTRHEPDDYCMPYDIWFEFADVAELMLKAKP